MAESKIPHILWTNDNLDTSRLMVMIFYSIVEFFGALAQLRWQMNAPWAKDVLAVMEKYLPEEHAP